MERRGYEEDGHGDVESGNRILPDKVAQIVDGHANKADFARKKALSEREDQPSGEE